MQTFDQQCLGCGRHTQNCTGVYNKINHFWVWDQPAQTNKTWLLQRTPLYKMRGCDPMRVPEKLSLPWRAQWESKKTCKLLTKNARSWQTYTELHRCIQQNEPFLSPTSTNKQNLASAETTLYKMKGCDPMRVPENRLFPGERNGKAKNHANFWPKVSRF